MIPINVDRNVSHADTAYKDDRLVVTRIFKTIQGEGPFAGYPALFIRLAGCNIGAKEDCPWCDTYFALDNGSTMPLDTVREVIEKTTLGPDRLIVVTGGEPLLQFPAMRNLIAAVPGNPRWQFETNGLLLDEDVLRVFGLGIVNFVVSPKIPHNRTTYRPTPVVWQKYWPSIFLKYVVTADETSPYHNLPEEVLDKLTGRMRIYVSGMTAYTAPPTDGEPPSIFGPYIDTVATRRNYAHAAYLARKHGLYLSLQTHLFAGVE